MQVFFDSFLSQDAKSTREKKRIIFSLVYILLQNKKIVGKIRG
jgi:hypothetical protein